jgi:hypothetical protein
MTKLRVSVALLVMSLSLFVGCGMPIPPPALNVQGPHDGNSSRLPDDRGFVEIVNEPEVPSRASKQPTSIVAYFYQPDGKTPMTPPPSDVRVVLDLGRRRTEKLAMKAEPKSGDTSGACRFASKTGPYQLPNLRGQLSASVGGRQVDIIFEGER